VTQTVTIVTYYYDLLRLLAAQIKTHITAEYKEMNTSSSSFNLSKKCQTGSKSLTMQTGEPGIEACTYSCPELKGGK